MSQNTKIELIASNSDKCGEAPIWDAVQRRLVWADITVGVMFEHRPATNKTEVLARDLAVSGIALNDDGRLVIAGSQGLLLWRKPGDQQSVCTTQGGETLNFNDMIADLQGRIYAGTYYWGADGLERPGKLYLIHTDGTARIVEEGIELSNGLGFSPDNRILYYADTTARRIYAYHVDPGSGVLSNKKVFVQVPLTEGLPDGLTVDNQGYVWSAQWYGAQVVRYDPDGKVERRIAMPVRQVSSVAFGGTEWNDLYITTAAESWPSKYAPPGYDFNASNIGGSLYRVRLDVQGRAEHLAKIRPTK
jgi:sugar lactone lactonase YvrE